MKRGSSWELADIIGKYRDTFLAAYPQPAHHLRTLDALVKCRTAALGGHVQVCTSCGTMRICYNSCRNRHCPKCQGNARTKWVQARIDERIPVTYYHVVFTLPHELNSLCIYQPNDMYNLLFQCGWETLQTFGRTQKYLGAKIGMIALLHTWGQNLELHPHIHCLVPAGGITGGGKWKHAPIGRNFYFQQRP